MNDSALVYDLVGTDDRRMSPFCWRAKLALAHKGISFVTEPVKFTEKHKIKFSGQQQLPVLVDAGNTVYDSWAIACYLEKRYPDRPALLGDSQSTNLVRLFNHWFDEHVMMALFPLMVPDNFDVVCAEDLAYYTESRFQWLGKTREELAEARTEQSFVEWRTRLEPLRECLRQGPFIGGDSPLYSDYIAFSMFMWARAVSPWPIILPPDELYPWRERMLDLHGGLARNSPGYRY